MEDTKGVIKALFEFQQAVPAIKKDSEAGTKFTYKYGSLPHIVEAIKPHLKKAGLVYTQPISWRDGAQFIYTTLFHVDSGEKIESKMILPDIEFSSMNIVQSAGAVITYYRRYALMSILGLVTEDDDTDAVGKAQRPTQRQAQMSYLNPLEDGKPNEAWQKAVVFLSGGGSIADIKKKYRIGRANEEKLLNEAMAYVEPDVKPGEPNQLFDEQGNLI